jgi:hypothetical protein
MTKMKERHPSSFDDEDDTVGSDECFWKSVGTETGHNGSVMTNEDGEGVDFLSQPRWDHQNQSESKGEELDFYPAADQEDHPSFECVLDPEDLEDEEDEESLIPPPPPSPMSLPKKEPTRWHRPALLDEDEDLECPESIEQNSEPVPSDEGHAGAIVLETLNVIEASDSRNVVDTMMMLTGGQTRVTLIPDTKHGQETFQSIVRQLIDDKDEVAVTKDFQLEHLRRNRKFSLMAAACLLLGLTVGVLILGVQKSRQNDVRTVESAAATSGENAVPSDPTATPSSTALFLPPSSAPFSDVTPDGISDGTTQSPSSTTVSTLVPTSSPSTVTTSSPSTVTTSPPIPTCISMVEVTSACYTPGSIIRVTFQNCEVQADDWVGLYEVVPDLDPTSLESPIDWLWNCGTQVCTGDPASGDLFFSFTTLTTGASYQPFMFHSTSVSPYASFVSGKPFQVADVCTR